MLFNLNVILLMIHLTRTQYEKIFFGGYVHFQTYIIDELYRVYKFSFLYILT